MVWFMVMSGDDVPAIGAETGRPKPTKAETGSVARSVRHDGLAL